MIIEEISIKGFKSFGNTEQTLKLNTDKGELILLWGSNGAGKSVKLDTEIEVDINIENMSLSDLNIFLDVMGEGNEYIKYIKENNIILYEQYINQQTETNGLPI